MLNRSVLSDSVTPWTVALQAPLSMWILQATILEWVAMPSSGDLPNPGIEPRSLALQADSLSSEPPVKPKNTGVGSLSLLQWIFLTQELNRGLLHCRRILYQLSYQGSPTETHRVLIKQTNHLCVLTGEESQGIYFQNQKLGSRFAYRAGNRDRILK